MFISIIKNRLLYCKYYNRRTSIYQLYYHTDINESLDETIPDSILKMREKMRTIHNIDSSSYSDSQIDIDMEETIPKHEVKHTSNNTLHDEVNKIHCDKIDVVAIINKYSKKPSEDKSNDNVMNFSFGTVRLDAANNHRINSRIDIPDIKCNHNSEQTMGANEINSNSDLHQNDEIILNDSDSFGNLKKTQNNEESSVNVFDKEYFGLSEFNNESQNNTNILTNNTGRIGAVESDESNLNYFDKDFSNQLKQDVNIKNSKQHSSEYKNSLLSYTEEPSKLNAFDSEYFPHLSTLDNSIDINAIKNVAIKESSTELDTKYLNSDTDEITPKYTKTIDSAIKYKINDDNGNNCNEFDNNSFNSNNNGMDQICDNNKNKSNSESKENLHPTMLSISEKKRIAWDRRNENNVKTTAYDLALEGRRLNHQKG